MLPAEKPATTPSSPTALQLPPSTTAADLPAEVKWLSLDRWSADHGLGVLQRVSVNTLESFALSATNGTLIVTTGSRAAYWNGLDFRLGFAPQMINGQLFLNALDLQKNVEPLLRDFAVPTGANRTIVIDPGHGGSNTGARSAADGRFEKEFTLDWARRLAPLLEERGWRVFLTRVNDVDVSLAGRVAFAEQQHADFFVSLHFNSAGNGNHEPAGLETYCLTPVGLESTVTRGFPDDVSAVFPNNAFDEQNVQYAIRLHRALLEVNGSADRGVRRARYQTVIRGQQCPAVLIEGGFLSNLSEARRIADPAYRQKLAEAIARSLE